MADEGGPRNGNSLPVKDLLLRIDQAVRDIAEKLDHKADRSELDGFSRRTDDRLLALDDRVRALEIGSVRQEGPVIEQINDLGQRVVRMEQASATTMIVPDLAKRVADLESRQTIADRSALAVKDYVEQQTKRSETRFTRGEKSFAIVATLLLLLIEAAHYTFHLT